MVVKVSVPLPGFSGLRLSVHPHTARGLLVSVPLPGFSGLRLLLSLYALTLTVSVPVPGFSGLRHGTPKDCNKSESFSPVAGIQWVETFRNSAKPIRARSFSPVAGIQWVETCGKSRSLPQCSQVSVPLPGFSGLRLDGIFFAPFLPVQFQSRCRDSVG